MSFKLDFEEKNLNHADLVILSAFQHKDKKGSDTFSVTHWNHKEWAKDFSQLPQTARFTAGVDEAFTFHTASGKTLLVWGMGDKKCCNKESIRKVIAKAIKQAEALKTAKVYIDVDSFNVLKSTEETVQVITESLGMTIYKFDKYLSKKSEPKVKEIVLHSHDKKAKLKCEKAVQFSHHLTSSINLARDYVNEVPNVLRSTVYAKMVQEDVKKSLKGHDVKVKVLGRKELEKENMHMFLSVNNGSAYDAQLVHLTYTPKKATKATKHIALVGKGLVFDTGGYSLKPGANMMNMKFDMAGSASVYAAFRTAVLAEAPVKLTCLMAITDNAVNSHATMPDSVVTARNGKTVEILNTDAEGRLVLGDTLDYACDLAPDVILDAATLTGACLVALGIEVAAVLSNNDKLVEKIKASAANVNEYVWQLPIIPEYRKDIESPVADIKNIGSPMRAGTAIGAAFLEHFIKNDIAWAHFDIAGVADSQGHLPYCPGKGASGIIVRTMVDFILNGKH
jgi:leucyl aminopeptidase